MPGYKQTGRAMPLMNLNCCLREQRH